MTNRFVLSRRTVLTVPLAAAAVGALASCGFSGDEEPGGGSSGGGGGGHLTDTLRQASRPVNHLNIAFGGRGSPQGGWIPAMMWEGLINRDIDKPSEYTPGAATSWEMSDDGLTYTFHLREGLKWSNGDPLTAEDFVWTYSYYFSPKLADQDNENDPAHKGDPKHSRIAGMADYYAGKTDDFSTVGVKAPDDKTVEFTLFEPDYAFLSGIVSTFPLHRKSVEAHPKDYWMPENFVGNGPFVIKSYTQNSKASFELNKNYYDADKFTVTKREVRFNSAGPTAMMVSYNANEIDLFRVDGDPAALISGRPDLAEQLKAATQIQFKGLCVLPCKNPILQENQKLRQALSLAMDREAMAKVAPPDAAAQSWAPPGITGYDKLPKLEFDPDKAKQLMAEAGFEGGKGVPELQVVTYAKMPALEAAVQMWQEHLGIKASVAVREVGVFSQYIRGNIPDDFTGLSFNYRGINPPMMLAMVGKGFNNYNYVPSDVAQTYYDLTKGKDKNKYSPAETVKRVEKLLEDNWLPEYREFDSQAKEAVAAQNDPDKALQLSIKAATTLQESYLFLPILWAGYSYMVKPRIHDLHLGSIASSGLFPLQGVTLDPVKD